MAVTDLFSKRQKVLREGAPDVYEYAQIPQPLRVKITYILRDLFGHQQDYDINGCLKSFEAIEHTLRREHGLLTLGTTPLRAHAQADDRVIDFVLQEPNHEWVLDVVEYSFGLYRWQMKSGSQSHRYFKHLEKAIEELNARFREHAIGYQYESGQIIQVDSQLIHAEVVKPALALLAAPGYAGPNDEFLKAFKHYRKRETKDCLSECLKAFESTMKAICTKRGWTFNSNDTAKPLIDVCLKNGLIPPLLQTHIGGVRAALESGIPTIRNRLSAHGQGAQVVIVPEHYASYMLHLTATTIQFLVQSEKALP